MKSDTKICSANLGLPALFPGACYALIGLIFLALFVENFLFSSHLGLLGFRHVDDVAFQTSLRRIHLLIQTGSWQKLWALNEYGYGWIFWASVGALTYPLFLLASHFAIFWPLIALPRQSSLVCAGLTLFFLHKSLARTRAPKWAQAGALLLLALYPTVGYFSLRFGTVNAVMMLSALAFYLAQRDDPSTAKGRMQVALALSLAGGIKLSGLLILPLCFGMVLLRLRGLSLLGRISAFFAPAAVFLVALLIFTNPALLAYPFHPEVGTEYLKIMRYYLQAAKTTELTYTAVERFSLGILLRPWFGAFAIGALGGLVWLGVREADRRLRLDALAILAALVGIACYVTISIKVPRNITSYFTALSFLLVFGVVGYAKTHAGKLAFFVLLASLLLDGAAGANRTLVLYGNGEPISPLAYYFKASGSRAKIATAEQLEKCIANHQQGKIGHIFMDYMAPLGINQLTAPDTCISVA